jgi:hypothetical protein
MNHPFLASTKRAFFCGIAILALIFGGFLAWRHSRTSVPTEEVAAFLDRTVGDGQLRFSAVQIGSLQHDDANLQITVEATARTLRPLYSKIDAADYLQRSFQLNPESIANARRLLADKSFLQTPEFKGAGPLPDDPYHATILQLQHPAGARFDFRGVIDAHRDGAGWSFSLNSGGLEGGGLHGESRASFGDNSFVAGDPGDDARLRAIVTDLQAFASRVDEARRNIETARTNARDGRRKAFLDQIVPGRMFRGVALAGGEQQGTPLYLEITEVSSGNEVTALLRNEGGWQNARTFQGSWSADDEFETPVLNLGSAPDQAVANAGPFLENTQAWSFALHMDPQGGLSERNRHYQYQFHPLRPEQISELKARLETEFKEAMTATGPGLLYFGTASSKTVGTSEPFLLRFAGRSAGGKSIEALLESTTRSWKRPLHGAIISNSRRSGGKPVRLRSVSSEAEEDAPAESVFGDRDDLDIRLNIKEGLPVGEDGQFTYRFAVASEADLHRLEADRADRTRRFWSVLRAGIAYDGILREGQGVRSPVRLEITGTDRQTGALAARISSLVQFDICRDFVGSCDPSGGSIVLDASSRGNLNPTVSFNIPMLKTPAATTLHLALTGSSIAGRIRGDPNSMMEFSTSTFSSAPTEASDPNSQSAANSVFPPFPKSAGAYLLNHGSWTPLPKNGGHIVLKKVESASELRLPTNIVAVLEEAVAKLEETKGKGERKVPYLEFEGKDPRPKSNEQTIIVLFIGPTPSDTPAVELAAAETMPDGRRRVELLGDSPTRIRFGEQRLAAFIRQIAPGSILLTTTSPLAPGPYVFKADVGYELTQE